MRAAWAEINLSNLDFNIKQIINKLGTYKGCPADLKWRG